MFDTHNIKKLFKKAFTPITIMFIPHSNTKPLNIKIPSIGIIISLLLWLTGTFYVFSVAVDTVEYRLMKKELHYYSEQFIELKSTMKALKAAETEFRRLFSLGSKEQILESIDTSDRGSIDMEIIKQQIKKSVETIGEIKDYLREQRNIYFATPKQLPVEGAITSPFGRRDHPRSGEENFHSGIDVSASPGTPVKATADGIVSFSGWGGGNGNLVVLEHGFGFTTLYAHNKRNIVKVGQEVKRGEIIGYVGSTGTTTGPHVHYEVWKNGRPVNPKRYF